MKTQVHLVTLLIIDHDQLGAEGVKTEIENTRYANDCIGPSVIGTVTREVDWTDDHPLNKARTQDRAILDLFGDLKG